MTVSKTKLRAFAARDWSTLRRFKHAHRVQTFSSGQHADRVWGLSTHLDDMTQEINMSTEHKTRRRAIDLAHHVRLKALLADVARTYR